MGGLEQVLTDLLLGHHLDLLRLEAGTRAIVLRYLREMVLELHSLLAVNGDISDFNKARLQSLLRQSLDTISRYYTTMEGELAITGMHAGALTAHQTAQAISTVIVGAEAKLPTETYLARLFNSLLVQGAPSGEWWEKQSLDTAFRFSRAVRQGAMLGETNEQIVMRIVGSPSKGIPGVMDIPRQNARSLVHTSLQAVANAARAKTFEDNADVIEALVWVGSLDSHLCVACAARDLHEYSLDASREPLDGGPPWEAGPGALHWGALVDGTTIQTARGAIPIEDVAVGDLVKTHTGNLRSVVAKRKKRCERGIVRTIHTQSGRKLSATDDHPVLLRTGVWAFVGALEVGDDLLGDSKEPVVVIDGQGEVDSQSEDRPAVGDQTHIALKRALQLVSSNINFECHADIWSREVDDCAAAMVLRNPALVEDQSSLHHLLAIAHALQKLGRQRLGDLLALVNRDGLPSMHVGDARIETIPPVGVDEFFNNAWHRRRVAGSHSVGVRRVSSAGFLREAVSPMIGARGADGRTDGITEPQLLESRSHRNVVPAGISVQDAIGQPMTSLDGSKGVEPDDVLRGDQLAQPRISFWHEPIVALEMQTYKGDLYDLEVAEDASYIANGLVVSNCRCIISVKLKPIDGLPNMPIGERASSTGPVKGNTRFAEYLERQGVEFQDSVLGPGRAQLWRDGKLSLESLLDLRGNPLTLAELKAKYGRG